MVADPEGMLQGVQCERGGYPCGGPLVHNAAEERVDDERDVNRP
ncbi:hypothetical protein HMPREF9622_00733 [Cutibacterium modestum HL037PA3]|uniref:Uncharacterized protein n=1 Tax=Cutibacterium modestum HL044PA1 TaxID=765109 RepID=A0ABN0C472_9ACTN|nr:hypothetical protein HMPREF9607_01880 [Cutibacterium modestum HL044PA1]EFT16172.1 hypothetical protein HMPREF9622_00733 [Cutibacterium modestum HL037PA3]EGG27713.1 hypothetical protein PA08_0400 [Cutibacterium modestum P08]